MKFCEQCGKQLSDNAVFCSSCGSKQAAPQKLPVSFAQQTDPSLTRNIVLICIYTLLTLITIVPATVGGDAGFPPFITILCITALLGFFSIRPSEDHIDTEKMNLLKTVESFGISVLYFICFICSFFSEDLNNYVLVYLFFVIGFAILTVVKISKINIDARITAEKIIMAFTIVLIVISSFTVYSCLMSIMFDA